MAAGGSWQEIFSFPDVFNMEVSSMVSCCWGSAIFAGGVSDSVALYDVSMLAGMVAAWMFSVSGALISTFWALLAGTGAATSTSGTSFMGSGWVIATSWTSFAGFGAVIAPSWTSFVGAGAVIDAFGVSFMGATAATSTRGTAFMISGTVSCASGEISTGGELFDTSVEAVTGTSGRVDIVFWTDGGAACCCIPWASDMGEACGLRSGSFVGRGESVVDDLGRKVVSMRSRVSMGAGIFTGSGTFGGSGIFALGGLGIFVFSDPGEGP